MHSDSSIEKAWYLVRIKDPQNEYAFQHRSQKESFQTTKWFGPIWYGFLGNN